jgi:hypothetical protein
MPENETNKGLDPRAEKELQTQWNDLRPSEFGGSGYKDQAGLGSPHSEITSKVDCQKLIVICRVP